METITRYTQKICNQLQQCNLRIESRKEIIRFFQCWMRVYQNIYYLRALEVYRHGENCHVDMTPFKKDIWEESIHRFNQPEVTCLLHFVKPEEIPCPLEEEALFEQHLKQMAQRLLEEVEEHKNWVVQEFAESLAEHPILEMPYLCTCTPEFLFNKFTAERNQHIVLHNYPSTYERMDIQDESKTYHLYIPKLLPWQMKSGHPNFHLSEGTYTYEQLDRLILTMLLSFPIEKLKISFLDLGFSSSLTKLRNKLSDELKRTMLFTADELKKWIDIRLQQLRESFEKWGDLIEHNVEQKQIEGCYEICILNGVPLNDSLCERLGQLMKDGHHAGIYFVVLGDLHPKWEELSLFYSLDVSHEKLFDSSNPIALYNQEAREKLYTLLNEQVIQEQTERSRQEKQKQEHRQEELYYQPFIDATEKFVVDIGAEVQSGQTICFRLDEQTHVHAFVLGQTGSGKSVFLHTLLNNAMLKYSPDSLQFYLLDFKMGGVELNRYRSYPHVRALLVDESDPGITLEILKDIRMRMKERGEQMRQAGCQNLKDYNRENPNHKMPRLILLVDECHALFKDGRHKIQKEIDQIIEQIAKEGRNQGVHLIFATQTLTGCTIPRSIINQITDPYLLKCSPVDAQLFVENPTKILNLLTLHCAYHKDHASNQDEYFCPIFLGKEKMDNCLKALNQKSSSLQLDFSTFYFTGAQSYKLQEGLENISYQRYAEASLGRSLEVQSQNIVVRLKKDIAQNLLILGNNEQEQGLRVLLVSIVSLMHYHKVTNKEACFIFFVNENLDDNPELEDYLDLLADYGVEILNNRRKRQDMLQHLYDRMNQSEEDETPLYLFVSSQDNYAELKQNVELSVSQPAEVFNKNQKEENELFFGGLSFGGEAASKTVTTQQAWERILEDGPEKGIFTLLQLSKLDRLLFKESVYAKQVYKYFQHIAFLRTFAEVSTMFGLEDVRLDELSDSPERLRLCYLNAANNKSTVLSPYQIPTSDEIEQLLKTE